jgi:hypothetical protein
MRTPDGGPVQRDSSFLVETKCMTRDFADRHIKISNSQEQSKAADTVLAPGLEPSVRASRYNIPVTIYSEAIVKGDYNMAQYGTQQFGSTTFGRHTNFTKAVGDCTKDPSCE